MRLKWTKQCVSKQRHSRMFRFFMTHYITRVNMISACSYLFCILLCLSIPPSLRPIPFRAREIILWSSRLWWFNSRHCPLVILAHWSPYHSSTASFTSWRCWQILLLLLCSDIREVRCSGVVFTHLAVWNCVWGILWQWFPWRIVWGITWKCKGRYCFLVSIIIIAVLRRYQTRMKASFVLTQISLRSVMRRMSHTLTETFFLLSETLRLVPCCILMIVKFWLINSSNYCLYHTTTIGLNETIIWSVLRSLVKPSRRRHEFHFVLSLCIMKKLTSKFARTLHSITISLKTFSHITATPRCYDCTVMLMRRGFATRTMMMPLVYELWIYISLRVID